MLAHPSSMIVPENACKASGNEKGKLEAIYARAMDGIVTILDIHKYHPSICMEGVTTLGCLLDSSRVSCFLSQAVLIKQLAAEAVVAVMALHKYDPKLVSECCNVIGLLAIGVPRAVEALVTAMKYNKAYKFVVENSAKALVKLTSKEDCTIRAVAAGVSLEAVTAANDPASPEALELFLRLLANVSKESTVGATSARSVGALQTAIFAVRSRLRSEGVASAGLEVINNLLVPEVDACKAIAVCAFTMRNYQSSVQAVYRACVLLNRLTVNVLENCSTAMENDVPKLLFAAIETHKDAKDLVAEARQVCGNLAVENNRTTCFREEAMRSSISFY